MSATVESSPEGRPPSAAPHRNTQSSACDWTGELFGGGVSPVLEDYRTILRRGGGPFQRNHFGSAQPERRLGVVEQQGLSNHWFPTDLSHMSCLPEKNWASTGPAQASTGQQRPPSALASTGGLPDWALASSMASLKPRQTFRFGKRPDETPPLSARRQSPSHAERLQDKHPRILTHLQSLGIHPDLGN